MNDTVKGGQIPDAIQHEIVRAALDAAATALQGSHEAAGDAAAHARTVAEAGVRAWQIANGLTS